MKRGEVWWINFDPSVGGEIRKKRLLNKAGEISTSDMKAVEQAIRTQLSL